MKTDEKKCPFKAGDVVVYRPTLRGKGLNAMTDLSALKARNKYKISRIVKEVYLVVEGFENSPTGGLFWTEFSAD
jgi:hypothetical protein